MPLPRDFMVDLYDQLHDTPMQRKLRRIAPMPVGVVFIQWPDMSADDIRGHFRLMKQLGFTCLKGLYTLPGTDRRQVMHWALDEGIVPWWYDEGGWEELTDELLLGLGLDPELPIAEIRADPRLLSHQDKLMRARIDAEAQPRTKPRGSEAPDIPFSFSHELDPKALPHFARWLREQYGTLEKLREAWNMHHPMIQGGQTAWANWEEFERDLEQLIQFNLRQYGKEYRRIRDVLRFKADVFLARVRAKARAALEHDPHAPFRDGGEMGLFLPFAARATDMEGIADEMAAAGSFYPSIHLAWHFEEVDFEVLRPVYMQASLTQDWFKGGWAATWESTGGPQQFSGGKAPFCREAAGKIAAFTVDDGVMTQLMLSYLAAGFKGFGFWCWTARTAGWEGGEFALCDRQCRPTPRAVQAGKIGQAARRYRDELWAARKEPLVGVYTDFDTDAVWAAMAIGGRDFLKHMPMMARVGVSRALINQNIPWEYVTATDLRRGLAGRYKIIYLPAAIAVPSDVLAKLLDYVAQGGRLVLDMPGAWYDAYGRLLPTDKGSVFERTFGCMIRDFQYSSNVPRLLHAHKLQGFVVDLGLTSARAVANYDNGMPAVTEARVGEGTAVVLGYEAALMCFRPGQELAESWLVRHALGSYHSPFACLGAIVYRLAAPAADHYFLLSDGPTKAVTLDTRSFAYLGATDAVSDERLTLGAPIHLPAHGGRWLRFDK